MRTKTLSVVYSAIIALTVCSCNLMKTTDATTPAPENITTENTPTITPENKTVELSPIQKYDSTTKAGEKAVNTITQYLFGCGDKMEISVLDEPEMTKEVFVLPDGSINYLLVGRVQAEGKTPNELEATIATLLSKYIKNPKVSIMLKSLNFNESAKFASIIGAVQKPGKIEINDGERLIDAISKAGGLLYINDLWGGRSVANLNASYISRNGVRLDVSFDSLLRLGDMGQNILVQPNDFIYFAESDTNNLIVLGEVQNPNIIPFTRDISLIEAISRCGGFTDNAQKSTVIVLRVKGDDTEMRKVDLEAILNGKEKISNLALKSGDIVFVPEQGLSEYERYANYLTTFANLILQGYQVREQIRFPRIHRHDSAFY